VRAAPRIVAAAESDLGEVPDRNAVELQAQAGRRALTAVGLSIAEVDGVCSTREGASPSASPALEVAEYFGVAPKWLDSVDVGGSSSLVQLMNACAAIENGMASTVLITYGSTQGSDRSRRLAGPRQAQWLPESYVIAPLGALLPISIVAMSARRHMHDYGTTEAEIAQVAVQSRLWAANNPQAKLRDPISVDEVLASRLLSAPIRVLDCCLVSDGGGAIVVTSAERSMGLGIPTAEIAGAATVSSHRIFTQAPLIDFGVGGVSATAALQRARVSRLDIDVIQLYDAFTIMPLLLLEALEFCQRGAAASFIAAGATAPGGSLPMNTQGGGLAFCHPGRFGMFQLIEVFRQVTGSALTQVPGANLGLCHSVGGQEATHASVVLRGIAA
jgi:acetyl-CoA acetyltransferase